MLLGFLIITAYVPAITGASIPTGWLVIIVASSWFMYKSTYIWFPISGCIFVLYAALSLLWFPLGLFEVVKLVSLVGIALWASSLDDLKPIIKGLAFGLIISIIVSAFQNYGFIYTYTTSRSAGLFVNSNIYAEVSGMLLVLLITYRMWYYIPVTIPGLLVCSKSVLLALIISLAFKLWYLKYGKYIIIMISSVGLFVIFNSFGINISISQRLNIWLDTIQGLTMFGHGSGSFEYLFPLYADHTNIMLERITMVHNDMLQQLFNFGMFALIPIFAAFKLLQVSDDKHRIPLAYFLVIGVFGYPLFLPVTAFMAALVAGQLARDHIFYSRNSIHSRSNKLMGRLL